MKYLLPDFLLILFSLFFSEQYVAICIFLFKALYQISSFSFFLKNLFLAFPLTNLLLFCLFGYIRYLIIGSANEQSSGFKNFFKGNLIFIVVVVAFLLKLRAAISEVDVISPFWPVQLSKLSLLFDLVSTFCVAAILLHIFFEIKTLFKKRNI